MKTNRAIIIIALSTILIGALLIAFPANATKCLVMAIGALFLVPGIVGVATYVIQRRRQAKDEGQPATDDKQAKEKKGKNIFPFIGLGSILFGAVLLIIPGNFQNALLYILGAFLVLAGLAQIYRFLKLRKQYQLGALPYIVSALVTVAGIVVIVLNHNDTSELTSRIFGFASVVFGVTEIIYAIQFRKETAPKPAEPVKPAEPEKTAEPEKPAEVPEIPEKPEVPEEPTKPAEAEPAPSFQVPEYTTTNNDASYATAQPQNLNPTIEAEVDSET